MTQNPAVMRMRATKRPFVTTRSSARAVSAAGRVSPPVPTPRNSARTSASPQSAIAAEKKLTYSSPSSMRSGAAMALPEKAPMLTTM